MGPAPTPGEAAGGGEGFRPQVILIGVRSPGGPYLGTESQLYPTACNLQYWMPQAKQPVRQENSPTHQKKNEMTKKYITDEGAR